MHRAVALCCSLLLLSFLLLVGPGIYVRRGTKVGRSTAFADSILARQLAAAAQTSTGLNETSAEPRHPLQVEEEVHYITVTVEPPPTHAYLKAQQRKERRRPLIYIYDLPEAPFRTCERYPLYRATSTYAAEIHLPEALAASPYFTADPHQADFFYVWAWLYCSRPAIAGEGVHPHFWMQTAVRNTLAAVRQQGPFWDRRNGTDHIFLFTHDNGYCGFEQGEPMAPEISRSIILSHWGHTNPEVPCPMEVRLRDFNRCEGRQDAATLADHLPCFLPGKDAVVAHSKYDMPPDPSKAGLLRNTTLYFAGAARLAGEASYSHGVRQQVVRLFGNGAHPGFNIVDTEALPDGKHQLQGYTAGFEAATFCLALTGAGWGVRLKQAINHGCIPVIIADDVQVQWEEVLPYRDFAIRLPQHALYKLPEVLAAVESTPGLVRARPGQH